MLEKKVYNVPEEIDDQIGRVKLAAMGAFHRYADPGAEGLSGGLGGLNRGRLHQRAGSPVGELPADTSYRL